MTTTMFQTSDIIWKNINLTDDIQINLQYDIHHGLLNIFVKNLKSPCHINVLTDQCEPEIYYEISTTYVYDIIDSDENIEEINFSQTRLTSSSSSSCFDEHSADNDDGYSTHSLDDTDHHHQMPLVIPSSKLIIPSFSSPHYISPIRRLIEQLTWLNPFKKTLQEMMMMNHIFI